MGRAVIYTRVSTQGQEEDGYSLGLQEREGRAYCEGRHQVVAVESDTHSGHDTVEQREGLQAAVRRIKSGEADTLVVWRTDRAERDVVANMVLFKEVADAGGRVESVTEGPIENTPTGQLLQAVRAFAGANEWETLRQRTQAGITAKIEQGHIMASPVPLYGYHWVGEKKGMYEIDAESGPVVQTIYDKADHGWSTRRITRWLNEQGIPSPSLLLSRRGELPGTRKVAAEWSPQMVLDLLRRESYTGNHAARRYATTRTKVRTDDGRLVLRVRKRLRPETDAKRVTVPIPALVSVEQWERVQQKVKTRDRGWTRDLDEPLLNKGIAVCGVCGARMIAAKHHGHEWRIYLCTRRSGSMSNDVCPGRAFAVRASEVDADVWAKVKEIIRDDARFTRLVQGKSAKLAERHAEAVQRAEATARMLDEMREKQATVYARMVSEKNDTIYAMHRAELERLAETVAGLEKRVAEAQAAVREVSVKQDAHKVLLAGVAAVVKKYDANPRLQAITQAYLIERGTDPSRHRELMASMHDAAEEVTLDSLDREQKRSILRMLDVSVAMYPTTHHYAKTHPTRWDFQFSDGVQAGGITGDWNSFVFPAGVRRTFTWQDWLSA